MSILMYLQHLASRRNQPTWLDCLLILLGAALAWLLLPNPVEGPGH